MTNETMEVNFNTTDLKPIVKVLAGLNPKNHTVKCPILKYIKITAHKDRVFLTATDFNMHVSFTLKGTTEKEGVALVDAGQLLAICQVAAPEDKVVIKKTQQNVTIFICDNQWIDFSEYSRPIEDFPPEEEVEVPPLELLSDDLRTLWASVSWVISKDEIRYYLNGIFFHRNAEEKLCAVATDGHRLAFRSMDFPETTLQHCFKQAKNSMGFIVPAVFVRQVLKFLPKKSTNLPVQIKIDGARIHLKAGDFRISVNLIDGSFPDYERAALPKKMLSEAKLRAELPAEPISKVIKSIKRMGDKTPTVLRFDFSATSVDMVAETTKGGRIHSRLSVNKKGEDMSISFDAGYVLDILSNLESETPVLCANHSNDSVLIYCPDKPDHLCVLMPVRVSTA